tara:strand:+ start:640 stop:1044 length:405 start_codon:yes stop_codon:yes gene_type:complete
LGTYWINGYEEMLRIQDIRNIHAVFNTEVFGGELSAVAIGMKRSGSSYGAYIYGSNVTNSRINISKEIIVNGDMGEILGTLAHEMCHQAQFEFDDLTFKEADKEMQSHGDTFQAYLTDFKERFKKHQFINEIYA